MAPLKSLLLVSALTSGAAFAPAASSKTTTALKENFGFDFAEDMTENTPSVMLGEANYKQWVGEKTPNSFLNRQVSELLSMIAFEYKNGEHDDYCMRA
jgi:hypothetical protein